MTDQELIAAADRAGLCFPKCWFLNGDGSPLDDLEDAKQRYKDDPEGLAAVQAMIDREEHQRQENLAKLRRFAALIEEALIDELHLQADKHPDFLQWSQQMDHTLHAASDLAFSVQEGFTTLRGVLNTLKQNWISSHETPDIESDG